MKKQSLILLLILGSVVACVKPYDFDPLSYEKVLVIDGAVTNEPGPYEVSITYTFPLDGTTTETVNDAQVWVTDGAGLRTDFSADESGVYTSPPAFRGVVGNSYSLFVEMPDGSLYTSDEQLLRASPEIDSIYGKYAQLPDEADEQNVGGIQFFIDSHDDSGNTRHYRYEWEEAYKIQVPYPAHYEVVVSDTDTAIVPLDTPKGICYQEYYSNSLIYGTSVGSRENRMAEFPVRFVSEKLPHLRTRYALLVKQYAISESAYLFYKRLRENNESGGSLFDKQTGSIFGNIHAADNTEQSVLGYFEVSGVSSKRRFFYNRDLDERLRAGHFPYSCLYTERISTVPDSAYYYLQLYDGNIYALYTFPPSVDIYSRGCTDCSFYAEVIPPDYWVN
ncbi:MAG: DUF4249 domain-containing protein [Marinoscillum sp.]|uniref:DUF4249 domain-containing protein n=1 Tax=Marinoscillum sp. TaxID=2024838 RepID=UPI0032FBF1FA